ncbi:MAG TPA: hypothetical protein DCR68_02305 [Coprothermobacter sp.]|nr:hypothetical protein [Coprothermobacter sp.]
MRKILPFLVCFFLLVSQCFAVGLIGRTQGLRLVASGTFTKANARCSYVDGTAFAEASGLDLSAYAGTDLGSTPYFIQIEDSAGKVCQGYLGAAGVGETLGAELLTNPTFDANTTGWEPINCTIASVAGGQSNNCCELTRTGGTTQYFRVVSTTPAVGALVKASFYVKSGTSGNESYSLDVHSNSPTIWIAFTNGTSSDSWVQASGYMVNPGTGSFWFIPIKNTATAGTMLFDETSLKTVADCAVTGLHVMSTKNGTTQNWASQASGFNYGDSSGYKYRVYKVN